MINHHSHSFLEEDYFKFDWEVKNPFKPAFDSCVVDHIFLGIVDFYFLNELVIDELNSITGTCNGKKVPYSIWLLPEHKKKVDFIQFSAGSLHPSIELHRLLTTSFLVDLIHVLLYNRHLGLMLQGSKRSHSTIKDPAVVLEEGQSMQTRSRSNRRVPFKGLNILWLSRLLFW